jgi:hypothetical protein
MNGGSGNPEHILVLVKLRDETRRSSFFGARLILYHAAVATGFAALQTSRQKNSRVEGTCASAPTTT